MYSYLVSVLLVGLSVAVSAQDPVDYVFAVGLDSKEVDCPCKIAMKFKDKDGKDLDTVEKPTNTKNLKPIKFWSAKQEDMVSRKDFEGIKLSRKNVNAAESVEVTFKPDDPKRPGCAQTMIEVVSLHDPTPTKGGWINHKFSNEGKAPVGSDGKFEAVPLKANAPTTLKRYCFNPDTCYDSN